MFPIFSMAVLGKVLLCRQSVQALRKLKSLADRQLRRGDQRPKSLGSPKCLAVITITRWCPPSYVSWFVIPLTIDISPTKTIVIGVINQLSYLGGTNLVIFSYNWLFLWDYRRKFRSQTSDDMDRWKAEQGRGREKRKIRRKKSRRERVRCAKGRKVAIHCVFPMICGSGGSKSRLAKAAGAELAGQMRDEKLHAVVARSTFPSQNVQSSPGPDHFWQLRCRKSARRSGAKHISKSKCTKHTTFGPLLEVEMSKKCTPLRREAHFEVKMLKTLGVRTTFGGSDVEKVHAVVARSTFRSQNVKST